MLVGKTRTAADGAYALGHSVKESSGIKPHQLLGAGDFVLHQSASPAGCRRRCCDGATMPSCNGATRPTGSAAMISQCSAQPERPAGGWNRTAVDEDDGDR